MDILKKIYFGVLFSMYVFFGVGTIVTNQWDIVCTIGSIVMFALLIFAMVLNYKIKKMEEEP